MIFLWKKNGRENDKERKVCLKLANFMKQMQSQNSGPWHASVCQNPVQLTKMSGDHKVWTDPRSAQVFSIYWDRSLPIWALSDIIPKPIKRKGGKEWTLSPVSHLFLVQFWVSLWKTAHGVILILFHIGLAWWLLQGHHFWMVITSSAYNIDAIF